MSEAAHVAMLLDAYGLCPIRAPRRKERVRGPRISGITEIALQLGVTRQHLRAVLAGRRESRRLLQQYRTLARAS